VAGGDVVTAQGILELLRSEVAEGLLGTGCQVYAEVHGEVVVDDAVGVDALGRPIARDTLFSVYCAGKPVVAVALACLVEDGEVSFDDRLGDLLDDDPPPQIAAILLGDLLSHSSGLHRLAQRQYMSTPAHRLDALVASVVIPPGWRPGRDIGYSEVAAWHLLDRVVTALSGETTRCFVDRRVLEPIGVTSDLIVGGMSSEEFVALEHRLGVNASLVGDSFDPLLMERTPRQRCAANPAVGTSATAGGLGRFYGELLRALDGDSKVVGQDVLAAMVQTHVTGPDQVMGRDCSYGLGFMTELASHRFGHRCSPSAFGHSGNGGMTAAFGDPENGIVIAYHFNGRIDGESAVDVFRPMLITRMVDELLDEG
jgi:CubicO group peptidase (beta-lactamase class C family)